MIRGYFLEKFKQIKSVTHTFSCAGHGKGAPDGILPADRLVGDGTSIPNAFTMFQELSNRPDSFVKVFFTPARSVDELDDELPLSMPQAIPGTMKILYAMLILEVSSLRHRQLSCFCQYPTVCDCYNLSTLHINHCSENSVNENRDKSSDVIPDSVLLADEIVGKECTLDYVGYLHRGDSTI